ncbi:MAG: hypothetical protein H0U97_04540 [Gammaproteobacteria bacterium]|nr:hypothetical protein [Gammaproteobacteria bacterium]
MKNIGKPCAGEPHARLDEGGQALPALYSTPLTHSFFRAVYRPTKGAPLREDYFEELFDDIDNDNDAQREARKSVGYSVPVREKYRSDCEW